VTEQICRKEVTHSMEESPKEQKKNIKLNIVLKYHGYDESFPRVTILWQTNCMITNEMMFNH
jgi:hypothetical protein